MKKKKICVVTGSRAEYGLLRWVMQGIKDSKKLELQIVVTGMHLSPEFGSTYKEIENDRFTINHKIEMLMSSDTASGISKSIGVGLIGFADVFEHIKPDMLLVLGDRFEIFSAVCAALIHRIPTAHLHGGETTEGAFDESLRHSITKMSHLHFVAAKEYRNRVIQLGEDPKNVFLVGGLGIDNIKKLNLYSRSQLEKKLNLKFKKKNLLITYHPVTLDNQNSHNQIIELLSALDMLEDVNLIFTMPNADTNNQIIVKTIKEYAKKKNIYIYDSLGHLQYLSCIKYVDGVIGNSSSGLTEVPTFKKGTINIGDRQKGRLKADSVIDCDCNYQSIYDAIKKLYSTSFQSSLKTIKNPYGNGGSSDKVLKVLHNHSIDKILKKKFFNL
jgi:GDP/UDP-N,N'-diacetylbacillosamine 2-epimerase (hydrolysing)